MFSIYSLLTDDPLPPKKINQYLVMICLSSENAESPVAVHTDSFVRNSQHFLQSWECIQSEKCLAEL